MTVNKLLVVVAVVLFVLAALVGGGAIDPDPALLRWQVLTALGLASWAGASLV